MTDHVYYYILNREALITSDGNRKTVVRDIEYNDYLILGRRTE